MSEPTTSEDLVRDTTRDLLSRLQCPGEVTCEVTREEGRRSLNVRVQSEHSQRLIGQHGANLQALQYVVRLLVSAKTGKPCFARVDVNGYRAEREQKIIDIAKEGAEKAARTDSMVILRPMSAYERRLVHVELQGSKSVTTESLGQEPNRRVVVKPVHASRVVKSFADKGFTLDDIKV
jgi:spoIIIJ-associated protein